MTRVSGTILLTIALTVWSVIPDWELRVARQHTLDHRRNRGRKWCVEGWERYIFFLERGGHYYDARAASRHLWRLQGRLPDAQTRALFG